jgi:hypothetical protein
MDYCINGHKTLFLEICVLLRCDVLWCLIAVGRVVGETSRVWLFYTKKQRKVLLLNVGKQPQNFTEPNTILESHS